MSARRLPIAGDARAATGGLMVLAGLALLARTMGPRLWAEAAYGPICSVHGSGPHCPSCYAAVALMLAALTILMAPRCGLAARRRSS